MRERLEQPKLHQDKKMQAVLQHSPDKTLLILCISRWISMRQKTQSSPTIFFVEVFTVSLPFWFHMLLCKKELCRSATEDSRKFLYFMCTSPVWITVTANLSWFFNLYTWNQKISWSEICYCEKGSSITGMNMEDYFHWCIHHTIVYDLPWHCRDKDCHVFMRWKAKLPCYELTCIFN